MARRWRRGETSRGAGSVAGWGSLVFDSINDSQAPSFIQRKGRNYSRDLYPTHNVLFEDESQLWGAFFAPHTPLVTRVQSFLPDKLLTHPHASKAQQCAQCQRHRWHVWTGLEKT